MTPPEVPCPRSKLVALVRELALEVRGPGEPPFVLKSGRTSRCYLDCRRLTLHDKGLHAVVDSIVALLRDEPLDHDIDAVGGPSVGADPIVGGLLYRFGYHDSHGDTRGFLVRPAEKGHGKAGRVIGSVRPGDDCLLIEDVATTGGSMLDAIDAVEAAGARVRLAVCVVDRLEGAASALAARGVPLRSLLTVRDLGIEEGA